MSAKGLEVKLGPAARMRMVLGRLRSWNKQKVFCVGRNKTGTSSLKVAMKDLGYIVGEQRAAEFLFRDWARRDFTRLKRYCRTAQFFQDIPFSLPYTFQAMDSFFPGSKFILTIRDPEKWHESMVKFHRQEKIHGAKAYSLEALREAEYCYRGFAYETKTMVYDLPGDDPYDRETLISHFNFHNRAVMDYFKNRRHDLLVLDVSVKDAFQELCAFLEKKCDKRVFPFENASD